MTSEVQISHNEIRVIVPATKSEREIRDMIVKLNPRITKKYKTIQNSLDKNQQGSIKFKSYLGHQYPIHICAGEDMFEFKNRQFMYRTSKNKITSRLIEQYYQDWIYKKAQTYLPQRTSIISKKIGIKPSQINIKKHKSRWGSATKNHTINLNAKLLALPRHLIDYVIVHELCHIKIRNHSKRYWSLVAQCYPQVSKSRTELDKYAIST